MQKILTMFCLLIISGCNNSTFRPMFYPELPKNGDPLYQQGFKEGCNTGMTVYGNDIVRAQYHMEANPALMQNKTYSNAWKLGNRYCRFHVSQMQAEGTIMKDFGTPIYPNRMLSEQTNLIRERTIDGFWMSHEDDGGILTGGLEMPWYQVDNSPAFDGVSIGTEGGVFGLLQ